MGIAAKYAVDKKGLSRVAVIDFDVHRGILTLTLVLTLTLTLVLTLTLTLTLALTLTLTLTRSLP